MTAMKDRNPRSVPDILHFRVEETPDGDAFYYPDANESWQTVKWGQVGKRARDIAMGLHALGVEIEDRCSILGITSMDWVMADLGVLCAGGATTTIYPSNTPEECRYILADSKSKVVFVDDDKQAAKMLKVRDQLPNLEKVVVFNGTPSTDGWIITMEDLETLGRATHITVVTDSAYVKNGVTTWIHGWKRNGWRTAGRKPVKNADLWQRLDEAQARHDVTWKWVKGLSLIHI